MARQLATVLLPLPPFIVATVMICLMVPLLLTSVWRIGCKQCQRIFALDASRVGGLASTDDRFPIGNGSIFRTNGGFSGRSAAAAVCRYNGLEHIKRLPPHLTGGLAVDRNVQDVSGAERLALPIDIESHAVVCRGADHPDGQTPPTHDQRLICFDVVGIF